MANTPEDPRDQVFTCPGEVFRARLPPGRSRHGPWPLRFKGVRNIERCEHHARNRVVAERIQVQPIWRPHAGILNLGECPLIGNNTVVFRGDGSKVFVVDRHLSTKSAEHRGEAHVGSGEQHDRGAVAAEPFDGVIKPGRNIVGVCPRADHVVSASGNRDQIRVQCKRRLNLLVDDLPDQLAAHGEVRIRKILCALTEHLSDPVGPTPIPARAGQLRVADALREGVAESDVTRPRMLLLCHLFILPVRRAPGSYGRR